MPDSSLIPFDKKAAEDIVFKVLEAKEIKFQFAPKIVSDTNTSAWLEEDVWGQELLRIHKGSIGRRVVFEWEYVASDNTFTGTRIGGILRDLKSYFFDFKKSKRYPVVTVRYMAVIPKLTFFRLRDVNIQHGPELVRNGDLYPLHTKVSATLELALSGQASSDRGATKVNVPPVNQTVKPEWY